MVTISANDFRFNPPTFHDSELQAILDREFGVTGSMKRLEGERDQNTHVRTADGTEYVLKISSPHEAPQSVDFQIQALEHLREVDPGLPVPRHIPSRGGGFSSVVKDAGGSTHFVRLLTFVPGEPMLDLTAPALHTIRQIGELCGRLCRALSGFDHPAAAHFMAWDMMNGLLNADSFVEKYLPKDMAADLAPELRRLSEESLPAMARFPSQVIHSDVHAGNLLVDPDRPDRVCGIIDFGDMIKRPLVVDLAGSLASFTERDPDVVTVSRAYIEGFEKHLTVPDEQIAVLYDALWARHILSVLLFRFRLEEVGPDEQITDVYLPNILIGIRNMQAVQRDAFNRELMGHIR